MPSAVGNPVRFRVRVWGMDTEGNFFLAETNAIDITPLHARLERLVCPLRPGAIIGVEYKNSRAGFRVDWVGEKGTHLEGQVGLRCVEPEKQLWGMPLWAEMSEVATAS